MTNFARPRLRSPSGYERQQSIEIGNPQERMRAEFQLRTNGRIRGVVVDEGTGRPIPNLVLRAGDDLQESKTDRTGM